MGMMLDKDEAIVKLVVYGKSGTGKTSLGVSAPRPLILLSERQGFRSVRDAAKRLGVPTPPTMYLQTASDLRACIRSLKGNPHEPIASAMREVMGAGPDTEAAILALPYTKPESIVCDSLTDFFRLISEDVLEGLGFPKAKDNQEVKSDRYWDLLRSRSDGLVTSLRDLPYHVVMLCLLDDRMVGKDDEATRQVGPDTPMRALASKLVAASNACGISYTDQRTSMNDKGEPEYAYDWKVRFRGPRYMVVKPTEPLKDIESPNVADWIERIFAHDADLGRSEQADRDQRAAARASAGPAVAASTEAGAPSAEAGTPPAEATKVKRVGPRRQAAPATQEGEV